MKVVYKGPPAIRKNIFKEEVEPGHFNVLLTTYEYIMKDKSVLKRMPWEYIIVDEGHRMKNAQSKFAQILGNQYVSRRRILLTGTPLQNNLPELWSLLNFLLPTIFNSVDTFDQWFNKPFASFRQSSVPGTGADGDDAAVSLNQEERLLIVQRLHEVLRPFMLRRVKDQVLDQLPEKTEIVLRCDLSGWQRKLYRLIQRRCVKTLRGSVGRPPKIVDGELSGASGLKTTETSGFLSHADDNDNGDDIDMPVDEAEGGTDAADSTTEPEVAVATAGLNNVIMQLRKICNHPYLFMHDYSIDEDLIRVSGKFELLDRMLPKLKAAGHRVLMFSQMTQLMTILERFFEYKKFAYLRLDGSTVSDEREKRMYQFNDPNSPYFIFLLSTRAGGLGLNLATADTVFLFDSDWNPMMDAQAQDRAHRIGQKNSVRVFRLITTSPVEERILARATDKLNLTELVVEAGKFNKSGSAADKEMVEALLAEYSEAREISTGGDEEGAGESAIQDDDQINEMMALHESELVLYTKMDNELAAKRSAEWALTPQAQEGKPMPVRLMQVDDLPYWISSGACWHSKYSKMFVPPVKAEVTYDEMGNVVDPTIRKRKHDSYSGVYDEGMTDAQFDIWIGEKDGTVSTRRATVGSSVVNRVDGIGRGRGRGRGSRGPNSGRWAFRKSLDGSVPASDVSTDNRAPSQSPGRGGRRGGRGRGRGRSAGPGRGGPGRGGSGRGVYIKQGMLDMRLTQELIKISLNLRKLQRVDGSLMSMLFIDLPDAKLYPDYYTIISQPICLKDITRKLRDAKYNAVSSIAEDLELLCTNARLYNGELSFVYKDAVNIFDEYKRQLGYLKGFDMTSAYREQAPNSEYMISEDTMEGGGENSYDQENVDQEEEIDGDNVENDSGDHDGFAYEENAGDNEKDNHHADHDDEGNANDESYNKEDEDLHPEGNIQNGSYLHSNADTASIDVASNSLNNGPPNNVVIENDTSAAPPPLKKLKFSLSGSQSNIVNLAVSASSNGGVDNGDLEVGDNSSSIRKRPRFK